MKIAEGLSMFDLLAMVRQLCKSRGLDPSDYSETLYSANGKRWGASSILRKKGVGIDVVFQEFQMLYPDMFDSLDDFVDALAERIGRTQTLYDRYDPEEIGSYIQNEDNILLSLQNKPKIDRVGREIMEEQGLIEREGRKVRITQKAVKRILEMSLEEE